MRACCALSLAAVHLIAACAGRSAASGASSSAAQALGAAPRPLAFEGVTVVDVAGSRLLADRTVVVESRHVRTVDRRGKTRPPRDAVVIDARGQYLIPGLWDMHAHVFGYPELVYPLYIAHGVTGLRELGQRGGRRFNVDSFRVWQREIAAGLRVGPRVPGPSYDIDFGACGVDIPWPESVDEMRRAVDSIKAAGFTFIKVHGSGSRALYFALAAEARRVGLPFVGHLPEPDEVTLAEASDSGQRSIEHVDALGYRPSSPCRIMYDSAWGIGHASVADSRGCAALAQRFVRNGTWITLTNAIRVEHNSNPDILRIAAEHVAVFHRAGFPMLAGTDFTEVGTTGNGVAVQDLPGEWLHDELAILVAGGLTPLEALRTATLNPAQYLQATDSLGTIENGKLADLVLLDANPLADIHNLRKIRAVVANGRYFDRAALDSIFADRAPGWRQRDTHAITYGPRGNPSSCDR